MNTIVGLPNYSQTEIQNIVFTHIQKSKENFHFEDLDFFIQGIQFFGSRIFGNPKKKSDLDIKIQYTGTAREDDLLNALNDKKVRLYIEDVKVDFYPEKL